MSDDQAAGLGNGEVLPAANSGDEGDVADTLLQIATEVQLLQIYEVCCKGG